jgi:hypothetical protein
VATEAGLIVYTITIKSKQIIITSTMNYFVRRRMSADEVIAHHILTLAKGMKN